MLLELLQNWAVFFQWFQAAENELDMTAAAPSVSCKNPDT